MSTAERSTLPPGPRPQDVDETQHIPEDLVEGFTITDPDLVRALKTDREATGLDRHDEMWEGVYVVSPLADILHQRFVMRMASAFLSVVDLANGTEVFAGLNVSDREDDWRANYRIPDVAVFLPGNPATFRDAFVCGGPDLAVEILSKGDLARKKLDFYAKIQTGEVLLVDRFPWSLELYRLANRRLELVGTSDLDRTDALTSQVVPLTFRLVAGDEGRAILELARTDGGQTWLL